MTNQKKFLLELNLRWAVKNPSQFRWCYLKDLDGTETHSDWNDLQEVLNLLRATGAIGVLSKSLA